jgi:hypothetical protein
VQLITEIPGRLYPFLRLFAAGVNNTDIARNLDRGRRTVVRWQDECVSLGLIARFPDHVTGRMVWQITDRGMKAISCRCPHCGKEFQEAEKEGE